MKLISKPTTLAIIAIIIATAGYWYFFTGNNEELPLSVTETENQAQARFQALVGELTPISFDTSIFSDSRFSALVDLTTPVSPEAIGRLDPFAPIAGLSGN